MSNLKFKTDFVVDFETVGLLWLTLVASTRTCMQKGSSDTTQCVLTILSKKFKLCIRMPKSASFFISQSVLLDLHGTHECNYTFLFDNVLLQLPKSAI